jgi:hypothetical protein
LAVGWARAAVVGGTGGFRGQATWSGTKPGACHGVRPGVPAVGPRNPRSLADRPIAGSGERVRFPAAVVIQRCPPGRMRSRQAGRPQESLGCKSRGG